MQRSRTSLPTAAVLLGILVLTACTAPPTRSESAPVKADVVSDEGLTAPRSPSTATGGTLRIVAGTPDSLDPARSYSPWVWNLMRLYTRTLVTYAAAPGSPGADLVPDLATGLGVPSDGGRTWTYTLAPGRRFETGAPITAQDVKYGIERSFASDVVVGGPTYVVDLLDDPKNAYAGPYRDATADKLGLATVQTPDESTIVFRLNRPYADFDHILALPSSSPVPRGQDTGAAYGDRPVSSGPYRISSVDPVLGISLERNPYWDRQTDPVRTALPDRVSVRTGLTDVERDRRIIAGTADVDVMPTGVAAETWPRIAAEPSMLSRTDRSTRGTVRMLALPTTVPPMDNVHCRRAVAAALNRPALVAALGGASQTLPTGTLPTGTLWPRTLPGYRDFSDVAEQPDPVVAGRELAACGRPDGFDVRIAVPDEQPPLEVAHAVATALGEIGVRADVAALDPATYYTTEIGTPQTVATEGYGILVTSWASDLPTPATYYPPLVGAVRPTGNANYAQIATPELTTLLTATLAEPDPSRALAAWRELDSTLVSLAAYLPLLEERVIHLVGERLHNAYLHPAYAGYDLVTLGVR